MNRDDFDKISFPSIEANLLNRINYEVPKLQAIKSPLIESTKFLEEFQRANLASEFANHLLSKINQFDADLNSDLEVGLKLVSFGQTITFHVSGIGFYNPSLVVFAGLTDDDNRVELVQHVSQISFVLIALPKLKPEQPKNKIGFIQ